MKNAVIAMLIFVIAILLVYVVHNGIYTEHVLPNTSSVSATSSSTSLAPVSASSELTFDPDTIRAGDTVGAFTVTKLTTYAPFPESAYQDFSITFLGGGALSGMLQENEMCGPYIDSIVLGNHTNLPVPQGESPVTSAYLDDSYLTGSEQHFFDGIAQGNHLGERVEVGFAEYHLEHVSKDCGGPYLVINSIRARTP